MKMKLLVTTAAAAVLLATGARADDSWLSTRFCYATGNDQIFRAHETSVDLFGLYEAPMRHFIGGPFRHGSWGGGVGANYFFTRYLGIGAEVGFLAGQPRFVNNAGGNLIARLPIDKIHLAPYVFGGGGAMWNGINAPYPVTTMYADAGVGLEWRLNPHLGLFSDARYIWRSGTTTGDQAAVRAGVRLGF